MEQEHGMAIRSFERRLDKMIFCIQASNPRILNEKDEIDETLSSAIETIFPMMSEDAIMVWNNIHIPLSYKYDISYMMNDIVDMLNALRKNKTGQLKICWLPDTFRSDWILKWDNNKIYIEASWGDTLGELTNLLNNVPDIAMEKGDFIKEWKQLLSNVINGLKKCGYSEKKILEMTKLIREYDKIEDIGVLYKD